MNNYNKNLMDTYFSEQLKPYQGLDMRYPEEDFKNLEEISKINDNLIKSRLLKTLENENLSLHYKISLIELNNILEQKYVPDYSAGGLMNDYNFTF